MLRASAFSFRRPMALYPISSTLRLLRNSTSSSMSNVNNKLKQNEAKYAASSDDVYSPEKDPMAGLSGTPPCCMWLFITCRCSRDRTRTEAEKDEIRQDIRKQSQRMFSYAYGIIGGGMAIAVSPSYHTCTIAPCNER